MLVTAFASVIDGHKGGIVGVVFGWYLTLFIARRRRLRLRGALMVGTAVVAVSGAAMVYFMGMAQDPLALVDAFAERLLLGNLVPAYYVVEMFGESPLLGRSFPNPLGLLPFEHFPLGQAVWIALNPNAQPDALYSAPSVLWSEMYANFLTPGVLLSALLLGAFARVCQGLFRRVPPTALRAGLIAFGSLYFMSFVTLGIIQVISLLVDYYLWLVIIATVTISVAERSARRRMVRRGARGTAARMSPQVLGSRHLGSFQEGGSSL
jgi:hypothetical protein